MVKVIASEHLRKESPKASFAEGVNLKNEFKLTNVAGQTQAEFVGTDNFAQAWYARQQYEVDAGRDEEPVLYDAIYNEVRDASLPRNVSIYRLGPGGVIFEEVTEGGEVKFVTVGQSQDSIAIRHYATGLEYSKDIVMYNELWNLSIVERAAGRAFNALKNHIHFTPILGATYPAANLTAASAVGATIEEKTLRTLEAAASDGEIDNPNRRSGPYILLIGTSHRFMIPRILSRVPQVGINLQSDVIDAIDAVVVYNGWTGSRGKKTVSYGGVAANTGYLISMAYRQEDFQSFIKQDLDSTMGNPDVSKFILEQTVWDTYFGVFANPIRSIQKITFPTL